MKVKSFDLSIIILNYNGRFWLEKLLHSLEKQFVQKTRYHIEVIVVDNCSTDDSVQFVKTFEWVKLMESGKNGGFAFGNNLALKDNQAHYVMLLNSDTELSGEKSNLDRLIEFMNTHENVGIITPRLLLINGCIDMACHRGEPTPWAAFSYFIGLEKLFPKSRAFAKYHQCYKNCDEIHSIDACSGATMMIRTSAMEKVGLLDERFFMYAEDIDWCRRFREFGYLVVYNPEVSVIHHKYKSGIQNSNQSKKTDTTDWFYDTMLIYYDKYYKKQRFSLFRCLLKLFILIRKKLHLHTH